MTTGDGKRNDRPIEVLELFGISGFAFYFGWMLCSFYWLFSVFPSGFEIGDRDTIQLYVFLGLVLGYALQWRLSGNKKWDPFSDTFVVLSVAGIALVPLMSLVMQQAMCPPVPLLAVVNLLAGIAASIVTNGWLEASSRVGSKSYFRFFSIGIMGGVVLLGLVALLPNLIQPVFCIIYGSVSVGMLHYIIRKTPVESPAEEELASPEGSEQWKYAREIEPSMLAFHIAFGMTFVMIFNFGGLVVLGALASCAAGALLILVLDASSATIKIVNIQRILLVLTVASCIIMPFVPPAGVIASACVVTAAWGAMFAVNYSLVIEKALKTPSVQVFRQVPRRVFFAALGFLIGWGVATAITVLAGAHAPEFTVMRLATAIMLVVVMMVFMPTSEHDPEIMEQEAAAEPAPTLITTDMSESDLFEKRCEAVAKMYQLSPRESEVLGLLAKGRNAAYIQDKLTISPHTVKSHIYSIYRKTDIHSQQKLMDFIDEYPIDLD